MHSLKITSFLFFTALLLLSSTFTQQSTWSQTLCETDGNYEPPSSTYRTVELKNWGITVDIPSNYRIMKRQDGSVEILHPDDYQWLQCLANGGRGDHGYYSETIRLVDDDPKLSLREQAIWLSGYSIDEFGNRKPAANQILPSENHGISGYIVTSLSGYSVSFLGTIPGQAKLLEVSAGCDCEVELEDLTNLLSRIKLLKTE